MKKINNSCEETQVLEKPEVSKKNLRSSSWQIVVHNDDVNLMSYVTMVFQKIFGFSKSIAEKHMLEVHESGRSVVWVGAREQAELYVEQLAGFLLLVTLEEIS